MQPRQGWPTWIRSIWHNAFFYRKTWRSSLATSTVQPFLYFLAMGLGIGALVDKSSGGVDGVSYLHFVAPGLLAATMMELGIEECTYPVVGGLKWIKSYWAKVATPLTSSDVAFGHLGWTAVRCTISAAIFFSVMLAFGIVAAPVGILVIPAAVLTGMATAAPTAAFSAHQTDDMSFPLLYRLGVLPMFLFSGIFFPLSRLPRWLQPVAQISPLTHGASLCRALTLDQGLGMSSVFSALYLGLWLAAGTWLTLRIFRRVLVV
jgi:lipooligosaccharide transport system permease protein